MQFPSWAHSYRETMQHYLFRGHEYIQLKPRSTILKEGIRWLHPPPVASPSVKRCSTLNAWEARNISACKKGKQKVQISGGGNAYLFSFPCPFAKPTKAAPAWERRLRWECEEQRQGRPAVPLLAAGTARREHPLRSAAGGRSQETEVLKLENRCRRK